MPFPTFFVPLFIKVIFFQTTAWKQYRKCTILLLLQDALIKVLVDLAACLRCSILLVYCKIKSLFIQYTIYYTVWTNVRNNENIKWNFANICREDLPMYLPTTNQMPHQLDYESETLPLNYFSVEIQLRDETELTLTLLLSIEDCIHKQG